MTNQVIPVEAVEAAAKRLARHNGTGPGNWEWYVNEARAILEAAAPHMLSHEREQARLAHLDAMVNRETKQAELAQAWAHGHHDGAVDQMLHMENGGAKTTPNPYMLNNEGEK